MRITAARREAAAYAAGRAVRAVRDFGPGIAGPAAVVLGVAHWSPAAAVVLGGVIVWAHDVVVGFQERAAARRSETARTFTPDGGPR